MAADKPRPLLQNSLQNMLCTQIVVFGRQHVLQMLRASEKDLPVHIGLFKFTALIATQFSDQLC